MYVESVTLIAPKSRNKCASDISVLTTPLSGILIIAGMLRDRGYSVKVFDESFKSPKYENIESDYILITSMSATVNRAYEIADFFKEKGKKVFMGGLHVSFKPEEALRHCDKVVIGEGENVLSDLMRKNCKQNVLNGTPVDDLDSIPMPDYSLVEGMPRDPKIVSVCTSRGCPFNCKFCSLKAMFGRKYRVVSTKRIIEYLSQFKSLKTLCFDEPNFTADKKRATDILKQMKEHSIFPKYSWPSVSIDVANDDKLLKMCSEVSNFHFAIGLESINQKALDAYNKKQTPDIIKKNIKKIKDYGIRVFGSFIFGSDHDDKTVFQKTVDFCHEAEIDFPTFSALTPYVGTEVRKEFENDKRIFTDNWDYYDGAHVVFYPKNMTPYELQEGVISAYENYYSTRKTLHHFGKGEFFYGFETFYVRLLFKNIIRQNEAYLDYLDGIRP
ncbi:MAG: B12-binding domain-containing radical SAM protein [Thermoplasmatota archaeon]